MKGVILTLCILTIVVVSAVGLYWSYEWDRDCGDYLKLAGDAPTVERAHAFLKEAVEYIESHNLTSGNTGIIFHRTYNDLGLWYGNIKGAQETLDTIIAQEQANPGSVTQLTKDNALMKIREVVLDHSKEGTAVTAPDWVALHPSQGLYWLVFWATLIIGGVLCLAIIEF